MTLSTLEEELRLLMPGRELRAYPALLSTEAAAVSWARQGAGNGALVVADYQASPRGRSGIEWEVPATGVCFSLIVRTALLAHEEGRLYMAATTVLSDDGGRIHWPDQVFVNGSQFGAVTVHAELDTLHIAWAVITALVHDAANEPASTIARFARNVGERLQRPPDDLAALARQRSGVLGKRVRAHLLPLGPAGKVLAGVATTINRSGHLVIGDGSRSFVVAPEGVGQLELPPVGNSN